MKFAAIFFFSLFGMTALATADAGVCSADDLSIRSAIAAKTGSATSDIYICAIYKTTPSKKAGYVETSVQYNQSGVRFCMREDELQEAQVTVKGSCAK